MPARQLIGIVMGTAPQGPRKTENKEKKKKTKKQNRNQFVLVGIEFYSIVFGPSSTSRQSSTYKRATRIATHIEHNFKRNYVWGSKLITEWHRTQYKQMYGQKIGHTERMATAAAVAVTDNVCEPNGTGKSKRIISIPNCSRLMLAAGRMGWHAVAHTLL